MKILGRRWNLSWAEKAFHWDRDAEAGLDWTLGAQCETEQNGLGRGGHKTKERGGGISERKEG